MFTLYMKWEAQRILAPDDIQFILTPREALVMASIFYELDYLEYDYQRNPYAITASRNVDKAFTTVTRRSLINASSVSNMTDFMMKWNGISNTAGWSA